MNIFYTLALNDLHMRFRQSEMSNITWQKHLQGLINKNFQQIISMNWASEILN